jgi:hypothetical protein
MSQGLPFLKGPCYGKRLRMKTSTAFNALLLAICLMTGVTTAEEKVPVQFTSWSLIVTPGTAEDPLTEIEWTSSFTSVGDEDTLNNELMVGGPEHPFSHETVLLLEDPFGGGFLMQILLDIPPYADVNNNGIDDFYDRSVAVEGVETEGVHGDENGDPVTFTAQWFRELGDSVGTVFLTFPSFDLQFTHIFYIFQYSGEFTYNRTGNNLVGTLAMTNILSPDDSFTGPLTIQVVNTNTLSFTANSWETPLGPDFTIVSNDYEGRVGTNFFSLWFLEDGYLATSEADYVAWFMTISSTDANGNGVLDLVDTGGTPSQRPSLAIRKTAAGYEITITGTSEKSYLLESTSQVSDTTAWPDHQVVTMTSGTQVITIPQNNTSNQYFRLREI